MRLLAVIIFAFLGNSCATFKLSQMEKETYYQIENNEFGDFDERTLQSFIAKSKTTLILNEETGDFEGNVNGDSFKGKFSLGKVSSGFVKGIYVATELGFLQTGIETSSDYNRLVKSLVGAKRLYFYNDTLLDSQWAVLEISIQDGKPLYFLKKK